MHYGLEEKSSQNNSCQKIEKHMKKKSAISLISYDANMFLADSIKRYYNYVDEIILGIDKDRITWSGNDFSIDEDVK